MTDPLRAVHRQIRIAIAVQVLLAVLVIGLSYQAASDLRDSQVTACDSSKATRAARATVYREQWRSDLKNERNPSLSPQTRRNLTPKRKAEHAAYIGETRFNDVDCTLRYPKPSLLPF